MDCVSHNAEDMQLFTNSNSNAEILLILALERVAGGAQPSCENLGFPHGQCITICRGFFISKVQRIYAFT